MTGLDSMCASYNGLELVDYQVSQEDICVQILVCSDFVCNQVCLDLCFPVGGGGHCDGTTCCCDCL